MTPSPTSRSTAVLRGAATTAMAALALAGCTSSAPGPVPSTSGGERLISAERCAKNQAAGKITYITGYYSQASVGILEEIAAADLGYYRDLCLDVTIEQGNGDTAGNAKLVAAGTAQLSSLGNATEVLTARGNGSDVVGIATMGHVPIATLMTMPDVTDLKQLDGTTLGQKGELPAPIEAMLVKAGVDVGSIKQVVVKYDPSILPRGQVRSLTGFKSNEPDLLAAQGVKITQWNPEDFDVSGSFGAMSANRAFVRDHPTAAQDFMRASLHAFEHCRTAAEECVDLAAKRDTLGSYDVKHNQEVWATESELVVDSTPDGQPIGFLDLPATEAEAADAVTAKQLKKVPDVAKAFDGATLAAIHDGTKLLWPAP